MAAMQSKLDKNTNQPTISTNFCNFWQYTFLFGVFVQWGILLEYAVSNIIDPSCFGAGSGNHPGLCLLQSRAQQGVWKIHPILFRQGKFTRPWFFPCLLCCSLGCPSNSFSLCRHTGGLHPGSRDGHLEKVGWQTVKQATVQTCH